MIMIPGPGCNLSTAFGHRVSGLRVGSRIPSEVDKLAVSYNSTT